MPFSGIIGYLSFFISLVAVWLSIPHEKRIEITQRKQYKVYVAFKWLNTVLITVPFVLFTIILKKTPTHFQWICGFGVPIIREITSRLRRKCLNLAFEETRTNLIDLIQTNIAHLAYISITLGTFATRLTGYVILSVDFTMNVWTAFKVSRMHRKIILKDSSNDKLIKNLQYNLSELALVEIIEFIMPVNYIVTLVIAMYGPNSSILGNYGNGYWQYKAIESLDEYLLVAIEMFLVDCSSFLVGSFILWRYCSINFLRKVCEQLQKHGPFIALAVARAFAGVSIWKL